MGNGRFNYEQLHYAFDVTLDNAKQLQEEAYILYVFEHYARSYSLYQFSIEEVGKCIIFLTALLFLLKGKMVDEKLLMDLGFRYHQKKTLGSLGAEKILLDFFQKNSNTDLSVLYEDLEWEQKNINVTNDLKNNSLYVSIIDETFQTPKDLITKEMVEEIAFKADLRIKGVGPMFPNESQLKVLQQYINISDL